LLRIVAIFHWYCFQILQISGCEMVDEAAMLAGLMVSAVTGGLAGLAFALSQDRGLFQALLSYQIGGLVAAMAFLALCYPVAARRS
jgi:hypothetical protein